MYFSYGKAYYLCNMVKVFSKKNKLGSQTTINTAKKQDNNENTNNTQLPNSVEYNNLTPFIMEDNTLVNFIEEEWMNIEDDNIIDSDVYFSNNDFSFNEDVLSELNILINEEAVNNDLKVENIKKRKSNDYEESSTKKKVKESTLQQKDLYYVENSSSKMTLHDSNNIETVNQEEYTTKKKINELTLQQKDFGCGEHSLSKMTLHDSTNNETGNQKDFLTKKKMHDLPVQQPDSEYGENLKSKMTLRDSNNNETVTHKEHLTKKRINELTVQQKYSEYDEVILSNTSLHDSNNIENVNQEDTKAQNDLQQRQGQSTAVDQKDQVVSTFFYESKNTASPGDQEELLSKNIFKENTEIGFSGNTQPQINIVIESGNSSEIIIPTTTPLSSNNNNSNTLIGATIINEYPSLCIELLKNICYYRYNIVYISNFYFRRRIYFNQFYFNNKNQDEDFYFLNDLVKAYLDYASNDNSTKVPYLLIDYDGSDYKKLKIDEQQIIKEFDKKDNLRNFAKFVKQAKNIRNYNNQITVFIAKKTKGSHFSKFKLALAELLGKNLKTDAYYDMFYNVLNPLYKLSRLFDNNINYTMQKQLSESKYLNKFFCKYYLNSKKHFFFYWVINCLSFFSKYHSCPAFKNEAYDQSEVDGYPEDFFIHLIIILHYCFNVENNSNKEYQESESFFNDWKTNIHILLIKRTGKDNKTYLNVAITYFCYEIKNVFNIKIQSHPLIQHLRIIQTSQQNEQLSDRLIPIVVSSLRKFLQIANISYDKTKKLN